MIDTSDEIVDEDHNALQFVTDPKRFSCEKRDDSSILRSRSRSRSRRVDSSRSPSWSRSRSRSSSTDHAAH